jgi:putative two-component system response regulator
MKTHAAVGARAIEKAMDEALAATSDVTAEQSRNVFGFMHLACEIALSHHEKWDGSGYPAGLAGEAIPAAARLMALADVFDALTCRRVYKPPMSFDEAVGIITAGRGSHFDPDVVDAFLALREDFAAVATRFADPENPAAS